MDAGAILSAQRQVATAEALAWARSLRAAGYDVAIPEPMAPGTPLADYDGEVPRYDERGRYLGTWATRRRPTPPPPPTPEAFKAALDARVDRIVTGLERAALRAEATQDAAGWCYWQEMPEAAVDPDVRAAVRAMQRAVEADLTLPPTRLRWFAPADEPEAAGPARFRTRENCRGKMSPLTLDEVWVRGRHVLPAHAAASAAHELRHVAQYRQGEYRTLDGLDPEVHAAIEQAAATYAADALTRLAPRLEAAGGVAALDRVAVPFAVKAVTATGAFTGLASTYGNPDLHGDVVLPGAFTRSLRDRPRVPVLWQHHADVPIGTAALEDRPAGLLVRAQLVLADPQAQAAHAHLQAGSVTGLSIGFQTLVEDTATIGGRHVRRLKEIDLWEVSVVTFPANERARILDVHAAADPDDFAATLAARTARICAALDRLAARAGDAA